jgi:hypothetical protein
MRQNRQESLNRENSRPMATSDLSQRQEWYLNGYNRGKVITCTQGEIWFTQTGDIKDYILSAGESVAISVSGPVAIRALKDSKVSLYAAPQNRRSLWSWLRKALMPMGRRNHARRPAHSIQFVKDGGCLL